VLNGWITSGKRTVNGIINGIPSGKLTVCELENGHRNSWFNLQTWYFSIAM
jgi:hypothetical protein